MSGAPDLTPSGSAPSHSKGPWYARLGPHHFTNSGQRPIVNGPEDSDQEYDQIALVSTIAPRTRKTRYDAVDAVRDANARLIAASPDLLAALKHIMVDFCVSDLWIEMAKKAIAKAEDGATSNTERSGT